MSTYIIVFFTLNTGFGLIYPILVYFKIKVIIFKISTMTALAEGQSAALLREVTVPDGFNKINIEGLIGNTSVPVKPVNPSLKIIFLERFYKLLLRYNQLPARASHFPLQRKP